MIKNNKKFTFAVAILLVFICSISIGYVMGHTDTTAKADVPTVVSATITTIPTPVITAVPATPKPELITVKFRNASFGNNVTWAPRMSTILLINEDNESHIFRTTSTNEQRYQQNYDSWTLSPGQSQELELITNRNDFEIITTDNVTRYDHDIDTTSPRGKYISITYQETKTIRTVVKIGVGYNLSATLTPKPITTPTAYNGTITPSVKPTTTTKNYHWRSGSYEYSYSIVIPDTWSEDAGLLLPAAPGLSWADRVTVQRRSNSETDNFKWLVSNERNNVQVAKVVKDITKLYPSVGPSLFIDFVIAMPYTKDPDSYTNMADWSQYPIETLYQGTGDCEDKSALLAVMLHEAGYGSAIIRTREHVFVGLDVNTITPINMYYNPRNLLKDKWIVIETTTNDNKVGDYSYETMNIADRSILLITPVT